MVSIWPKPDVPLNPKWQDNEHQTPLHYRQMADKLKTLDTSQITWTTAHLYGEFLKASYKIPLACEEEWNAAGFDPGKIWKFVYATHNPGYLQDMHFKVLHRIVPSKIFRQKRTQGGRNFAREVLECKSCKGHLETNEHIFFNCKAADDIWHFLYPTLKSIMGITTNFPVIPLILNRFPPGTPESKAKLVLTLIQIGLHAIWINRNKVLHDGEDPKKAVTDSEIIMQNTFFKVLKKRFREHMPDNLAKFKRAFCGTPAVCNVIDGRLLVKLS